jgi:competence protein ComEA
MKEEIMRRNGHTLVLCLAVIMLLFSMTALAMAKEGGKVNINSASLEELAQLSGIGPSYAERIVAYRDENGPFEKPEDLMKVKGIGSKTYEANRHMIVVE